MAKKKKISILDKSTELFKPDKKYSIKAVYPNNLMIEVTNACNLSCKMCYHKNMKRKIGFMTENLFTKVIDQAVALGIENVGLYTVGEAFLHPKIFDFIKIAKQKGVKYVYVTTNGNVLNEEEVKKIIDSGLDSIKFSIDAASKEIYEEVKTGAKWKKLMGVLMALKKIRNKRKSSLRVFGSFVITDKSFKDLFKYKKVFNGLVDETLFVFIGNQGGQVEVNSLLPREIKKEMDNLILSKKDWQPCSLLWKRFVVNYDGKLTICCVDFDAKMVYGDINESTLKECWNNEKMQRFRRIHRGKKFNILPLCSKCDFVKNNHDMDRRLQAKILKFVNQ
jgi:radical SAM protein with 4Fe4S-binding SPASM domain